MTEEVEAAAAAVVKVLACFECDGKREELHLELFAGGWLGTLDAGRSGLLHDVLTMLKLLVEPP